MVVLGIVERSGRRDLGRDRAIARLRELLAEGLPTRLGQLPLFIIGPVNCRAVLRPDIVALAHPLGRVMRLPEDPQQLAVAYFRWVEDHQHRLGVAGLTAASLSVGRVRGKAAGVADRRRVDPLALPELPLGAPETAKPENRRLETIREGRLQRRAEHFMTVRNRERRLLAAA